MGLTINEGNGTVSKKITVDRRLWLTADGDELVEDGDSRAATLWAIEGREVDAHEAERVGYEPLSDTEPEEDVSDEEADETSEPPRAGRGSGRDAWVAFAVEATGAPESAYGALSRDEIIDLLESEGVIGEDEGAG